MTTTTIYIRTTDNGQHIALTTMDIKVLLLRAGITITDLAASEELDCSREALSKTINGSLLFPEVRKKLAVKLERIAAQVAEQKAKLRAS